MVGPGRGSAPCRAAGVKRTPFRVPAGLPRWRSVTLDPVRPAGVGDIASGFEDAAATRGRCCRRAVDGASWGPSASTPSWSASAPASRLAGPWWPPTSVSPGRRRWPSGPSWATAGASPAHAGRPPRRVGRDGGPLGQSSGPRLPVPPGAGVLRWARYEAAKVLRPALSARLPVLPGCQSPPRPKGGRPLRRPGAAITPCEASTPRRCTPPSSERSRRHRRMGPLDATPGSHGRQPRKSRPRQPHTRQTNRHGPGEARTGPKTPLATGCTPLMGV